MNITLPIVAGDLIDWVNAPNQNNRMLVCTTNYVLKKNGDAVMGAGIALSVARAFPDIAAELGGILRAFAQRRAMPNHPTSNPMELPAHCLDGEIFTSQKHPVVFLPTKIHWMEHSKAEFVLNNLRALRKLALDMKHIIFGMTLPGAGKGGLDKQWSLDAVQAELGDLPNVVIVDTVFESNKPDIQPDILELIKHERILVVSGHRPDKLGGYAPDIRTYTRDFAGKVIDRIKPTLVVHGGALGIDKAFADAAEERGLKVIYAEPCQESDKRWNEHDRKATQHQRQYAVRTGAHVIVSDGKYNPGVMQIRNDWMIALLGHAAPGSGFAVIHNGTEGGTNNCKKGFVEMYGERAKSLYFGNFWKAYVAQHPYKEELK